MGTSHGAAKVAPDGKVHIGLRVEEETYHLLREWAREWDMPVGESIDMLVQRATEGFPASDTVREH